MSGLFGGGQKATSHATRAMGIDFQGAQYGPVVPVVYGRNKVPGNCIWYGDFQSHAQQQKAGKGGGGGSTTNYTYSASAQMGLCEGPGIGLRTVYDGTSVVNLSSINYAFASGAIGQAPWSHLSGSAALGYSLTAIFSFQNLDLGSQASLPNYNYELDALKQFSGSIPDANPKDILSDICSDPYHGVNFPYLGDLTQYSNYCVANGLFLSPVYDQQQSANQALSDLFKYTNAYVYYSEDQLKVVPLGDTPVTGNGVTFTPNVTPAVNLGTDDFIADGSGATITVDRKAPQDNLNLVRVEFKDRSNTYHDSAVVAAIDEDIITNGGRSDDSETVNGCTSAAVARFIAQNLVQRAFYIRNTYQFKLSWRYCYLEPTDIVTLTDAALGLNEFPVRITEIEEDGESALTITAEEFPEGIGHSAIYNTQPNGGTNIDQNSDPGAVNAPYLFRGPGFLVSNNTPEIWCAVNGSSPMWAGCEVYLSHDGNSYTFAGAIASQARYGSLTSALPAASSDPDTTSTPTVQLYAPGQLLGGSQTDADNFVTLAMVDSEIIAYETATLQAANTYQLGYLRRGGYGSANVAHSNGAPFVRLDDSIFRIPVDPSLIGSTVYLKFLSINAFGRTPRTLAEETAYTYVVGTNVELPDVPDVPASFAVQGVADGVSITWTNDNPAAVGCTSIERATASGGPWTVLAQVGPTTTAYHDSFTTGSTYYYRARARGPLVQSGWSTYTGVISSAGKTVANGATNGATIGPGGNVNGAVDGNGRAIIDFGQGGHLNKILDNIGDGPVYYRMPGSLMDGNRRALVDFSQSGHINKTLDNIADTATRFAAVQAGADKTSANQSATTATLSNFNTGDLAEGANLYFTNPRASAAAPVQSVHGRTGAIVSASGDYVLGQVGDDALGGRFATRVDTFANRPAAGVQGRLFHAYNQGTNGITYYDTGTAWQQVAVGHLADIQGTTDNIAEGTNKFAGEHGADVTGNHNSATTTKLATARNIAGLPFDGTASIAPTLANIPDDAGSTRYAVSNIDGNRRALIDATQAGHVGAWNLDSRVADGTNYARTSASALTGGNVDLAKAGVVNKNLGNIADGGGRYGVHAVDSNNLALIDFSQAGHVNKTIDNVGDGATYLRMPGANMDGNRRGLIDFTQLGHLSKNLDNIASTDSYARTPAVSWAPEVVQNASFTSPAAADGSIPGWSPINATISIVPAGASKALQCVIASNGVGGAYETTSHACQPGDVVSATVTCDSTAGNSAARAQIQCFNAAGAQLTPTGAYDVAVNSAYNTLQSASMLATMPANAATFRIFVYANSNLGATFLLLNPRCSINDVRVAGSGQQVGDQRNLPPIRTLNLGYKWPNNPTYSASAGSPATATISVPATNVIIGSNTVNYNAMSVSVSGTGGSTVTYYLYLDDPGYAGGSQTLVATTNSTTVYSSNGRVYVGTISVTFPTSGSGSGAGGGGGGYCVCDDMWVDAETLAKDAQPGHGFDCCDLPHGTATFRRALDSVEYHDEQCVRITTEHGAVLDCGHTTPFDTVDGRELRAPQMNGELVLTDHGLERVVSVDAIGIRRVCYFHFGGVSYAAGRDTRPRWLRILPQWLLPKRLRRNVNRIYSHNTTVKP